ncbi:RHS repeat-associated protein, partial [Providencia alcalifaciens]
VGRWLSSDPAGTVDGMNLFRMVRNNPILLKDDNGLKTTMKDNFIRENGDLVYGLSRERAFYLDDVVGSDHFAVIDYYNNAVQFDVFNNHSAMQNLMNSGKKITVKRLAKVQKKMGPDEGMEERVKRANSYPLWDNYFAVGKSNPKFDISYIYNEVNKYPKKSQYHEWDNNRLVPKLLWKRGSKIGIEMAASGAGNKIHFVLDKLNIDSVVKKEVNEGQSVTASELRYIYRNRERLIGRVHFYKDNIEVEAPWVTNPQLWSLYRPKVKNSENSTSHVTAKNQGKGWIQRVFKKFK